MNCSEKDRHTSDYQTVEAIAKEQGVTTASLFCESDLTAELVCLIDQLSESNKKALLKELKMGE